MSNESEAPMTLGEPKGQPEEARYSKEAAGKKVPVMEIFGPTIQGEGAMIGIKTWFVRMGGCDYRCQKCDSMHAVDPDSVKANARWLTQEELAEEIAFNCALTHTQWVTISGGNPAMWDLDLLVTMLDAMNIFVAVETQGSIWRPWLGKVDQLTVSPKGTGMGERFNQEVFKFFLEQARKADVPVAIKVVVFGQDDFEMAVSLDPLLDSLHMPDNWRYLSLGNPYPPELDKKTMTLKDPMIAVEPDVGTVYAWAEKGFSLPDALLKDYEVLLEDFLKDHRLGRWKFLPQLHVLIWSNKSGV